MKKAVLHIVSRLLTLLMLGLVLMLVGNRALFTHTHKIKDGTLVEHAHPYNKAADGSPLNSHHHSESGLLFLQNLGLFFLHISILSVAVPLFRSKNPVIPPYSKPVFVWPTLIKGRAPPLL